MIVKSKSGKTYIIYNDLTYQRINCPPGEFEIGQVADTLEELFEILEIDNPPKPSQKSDSEKGDIYP